MQQMSGDGAQTKKKRVKSPSTNEKDRVRAQEWRKQRKLDKNLAGLEVKLLEQEQMELEEERDSLKTERDSLKAERDSLKDQLGPLLVKVNQLHWQGQVVRRNENQTGLCQQDSRE